MRFTLVATRKGSIPMFMSLEMVEGASFVWRVERTKWPVRAALIAISARSEEHTSELQSRLHLVCRLLLEKKKQCGHEVDGKRDTHPSHPLSCSAGQLPAI